MPLHRHATTTGQRERKHNSNRDGEEVQANPNIEAGLTRHVSNACLPPQKLDEEPRWRANDAAEEHPIDNLPIAREDNLI
jgi:hypothetical protein